MATNYKILGQAALAAPASSITIDGYASEGGTSTHLVTTDAAHGFSAGDIITISGVSVSQFNGDYEVVTTPLTTTFTIVNADAVGETWSSDGTVANIIGGGSDLYTVPSATETIISTVAICNRKSSSNTFRIAVRPNGAAISEEYYIAYDAVIPANDSTNLTIGITLDAGDVVSVYGGVASGLSVSVFGSEIS